MNVLPRLLFLCQSLPIYVPAATFTTLNKWLSKFISQSKPHRLKLRRLLCPKDNGGPKTKREMLFNNLGKLTTLIKSEVTSLGVILDSDLSFKSHINKVTKTSFLHLKK